MIIGAHALIYSKNAQADRAFLRDVFHLPHVDAGEGWLIFGLPPAELGVHPGEENDRHEFHLLCSDIEEFVAEMALRGVPTSPVENAGWGIITHVQLPGGGKLGVYQPRHARPEPKRSATEPTARRSSAEKSKSATKKRSGAKSAKSRTKAKPAKKNVASSKGKSVKRTGKKR